MTIPTSVSITVMPNNTVGNFGLWIRFNSLPVCSGSPIWRTASCAAARVSFPPGDSPPSVPQCDCQSPCGLRIWHGDSRSVLLWHPDNPGCFRHSAQSVFSSTAGCSASSCAASTTLFSSFPIISTLSEDSTLRKLQSGIPAIPSSFLPHAFFLQESAGSIFSSCRKYCPRKTPHLHALQRVQQRIQCPGL